MNRPCVSLAAALYPERCQRHCASANLRRKQEQQSLRFRLDIQPLRPVRQSRPPLTEDTR